MREHSDGTFYLLNDIDMSGIDWVPIETFSGLLRGFDFKIKNLTINGAYRSAGFFAEIDDAVIDELEFNNVTITVQKDNGAGADLGRSAGVVAGTQVSTSGEETLTPTQIMDVRVTGNVNISIVGASADPDDGEEDTIGGLIGRATGGFVVMNTAVTLTSSGSHVAGGFVGIVEGNREYNSIHESSVAGSITANNIAGGFIGFGLTGQIAMAEVVNNANVTSLGGIAGGLVGATLYTNIAITDGANNGDVTYELSAAEVAAVGGFIGLVSDAEFVAFLDSHNQGAITAPVSGNVGGFIGYISFAQLLTFSQSFNSGSIHAHSNVGGFVGNAYSVIVSLSNVYNDGEVTVGDVRSQSGATIGGFFGSLIDSEFDIIYAYNSVPIQTPTIYAGGFIGSAMGSLVQIRFSLQLGNIFGSSFVGTFVGFINLPDLHITDSYYSVAFSDGRGGLPVSPLVHGEEVDIELINTDFFMDDLNFNVSTWRLGGNDFENLPTLL